MSLRITPINTNKYNFQTSKKNISFGVRNIDYTNGYECIYRKDYNGKSPDSFILNKLNQLFPEKSNTKVLDIGAGQGRNTIPIALDGYSVTALDSCELGLKQICEKSEKEGTLGKILCLHQNTLDHIADKAQYEFVFASHLSQHFSNEEMGEMIKNAANKLKKGGYLIFDANIKLRNRILEPISNEYLSESNKFLQERGAAFFDETKLTESIHKNGLKLLEITPFKEDSPGRACWEKDRRWGNLFVRLKWFVAQKA